jgi:hypothetical protein
MTSEQKHLIENFQKRQYTQISNFMYSIEKKCKVSVLNWAQIYFRILVLKLVLVIDKISN